MTRLAGTDLWHPGLPDGPDWRASYAFVPNRPGERAPGWGRRSGGDPGRARSRAARSVQSGRLPQPGRTAAVGGVVAARAGAALAHSAWRLELVRSAIRTWTAGWCAPIVRTSSWWAVRWSWCWTACGRHPEHGRHGRQPDRGRPGARAAAAAGGLGRPLEAVERTVLRWRHAGLDRRPVVALGGLALGDRVGAIRASGGRAESGRRHCATDGRGASGRSPGRSSTSRHPCGSQEWCSAYRGCRRVCAAIWRSAPRSGCCSNRTGRCTRRCWPPECRMTTLNTTADTTTPAGAGHRRRVAFGAGRGDAVSSPRRRAACDVD